MWKRLFGGRKSPLAAEQADDRLELKQDVERLLESDFSSEAERDSHASEVLRVLRALEAEIQEVRQLANGYPANPIGADVWMNGAMYSGWAEALTQHFKVAGWLKHERNASGLWVAATLAVNSHYHNLVGPAMTSNADCYARLGQTDEAVERYRAVVADFSFLVDEWLSEEAYPENEDRESIRYLEISLEELERLVGLEDSEVLLKQSLRVILSRTETD